MTQSARDGNASMLKNGGISQEARTAVRLCPWMGGQVLRSCNTCTSTFPGGRISQRARTVLWIYLLILITPTQLFAATGNEVQTWFHPFAARDQNLFNLIHGQALPTNARLNKKAQGLWSSSLIITNTLNIESNSNESIYLDYEAYRFNLGYQYGINDNWNLKLDIPLIHQSGGVFDSANFNASILTVSVQFTSSIS